MPRSKLSRRRVAVLLVFCQTAAFALVPSVVLACEGGGAEPLLASPNTVRFGLTTLGTTPEKTITFTADEAVKIESMIPAPGAPFGAGATNTCNGKKLAVGGTCQYSVTFSPTNMVAEMANFWVGFQLESNMKLDKKLVVLEGQGD